MTEETQGHKQLKNDVKEVMQNIGFNAYREVHFNLSGKKDNKGNYIDDASIDVLVKFEHRKKTFVILFECKDKQKFSDKNGSIAKLEQLKNKILSGETKVIASQDSNNLQLDNIEKVESCFILGKKADSNTCSKLSKFWSYKDLKYFKKMSYILKNWEQFEIFREFNLDFESQDVHIEDAIRIKQPGIDEMFITSLHPGLLLKIGYVVRRSSKVPDAYQRLLNLNCTTN